MASPGGLVSLAWAISSDVIGSASGCLQDGGQDPRTQVLHKEASALPGKRGSNITTTWLVTGAAPEGTPGDRSGPGGLFPPTLATRLPPPWVQSAPGFSDNAGRRKEAPVEKQDFLLI